MNIGLITKNLALFCRKHAAKILAGGAIVAEAIGFYFMHKEAPIVRDRLNALPEDATWKDKIKAAGPVYLPAIGMLLVSSGCIVGGCALGEKRAAMMAGLYSASEAALQRYERQVVDQLGPEKANELHKAAAKELLADNPKEAKEVVLTGKGNTLFFEPLTGRYFRSSLDAVKNDCADFKNYITSNMWGTVNDWYEHLGLPEARLSDLVGWNVDNMPSPYFDEGSDSEGELCWVIRHITEPVMWNGKRMKNFRDSEACYPCD